MTNKEEEIIEEKLKDKYMAKKKQQGINIRTFEETAEGI